MRNLCALLLIAGHETTANLIASGARRLSLEPELFHTLKADPAKIPGFVEEMVRMSPPLQRIMRRATRATEIAGEAISEGALVLLLPGSANRDDRRWERPDSFELDRDSRGHLGFGTGIHVCPGASLTRLEVRIAFEVLVDAIDEIRPDPDRQAAPIVGYGAGSLGWNSLPLIFTAR
jgi:cytochrome P450